jgi:hypothetical protein
MKLIRALCDQASHELERVTAVDPTHVYEGTRTVAWNFITDKGHYHMVEAGGKAIMFRGDAAYAYGVPVDAAESRRYFLLARQLGCPLPLEDYFS